MFLLFQTQNINKKKKKKKKKISVTASHCEQTYVIFTFQYVSIISIASIR